MLYRIRDNIVPENIDILSWSQVACLSFILDLIWSIFIAAIIYCANGFNLGDSYLFRLRYVGNYGKGRYEII